MLKRERGNQRVLFSVADVAMIFAPRHFRSVLMQMATIQPVVRTIFGAAKPRKIGLSLIGARAI
jgi:hypothetical protein